LVGYLSLLEQGKIRPFPKLNLPTTLQGRKALRPYEAVISLQEIA
jgi:hypothetical protein